MTAESRQSDTLLAQARGLLRRLETRLREADRQDLLEEFRHGAERSADRFTIVVSGEANRGKTSIINALVDRPRLLPVAADTPTAVPVMVRGLRSEEHEGARVVLSGGDHVDVRLEELHRWVTEVEGEPHVRGRMVSHVEVALDHSLLADGLTIVDTPGVGGLRRAHGAAARAALETADAVLFVLDAGAPISDIERTFLRDAVGRVGAVVVALNKIDVHPGFADIQREDEQLLARDVPEAAAPIFAVSARAKSRADRLAPEASPDDELVRDLRDDSGIVNVVAELRSWATSRASAARAASLTRLGVSLTERLLEPERAILETVDASPDERHAHIDEAKDELEDLKRRAPEVGRDVSDRIRLMQREVEVLMRRAVSETRHSFVHRVTDGDTDGLEDDLAAALYEIPNDVRTVLEERFAAALDALHESMAPHLLDVVVSAVDVAEVGDVLDLGALPERKAGMGNVANRAPYAVIPLALGNIPFAVAGFAAMFLGERVAARNTRQQHLRTYVSEACVDWERELGLMINEICTLGGTQVDRALKAAVRARQQTLTETIRALTTQVNQSVAERTSERAAAEQRVAQAEDVLRRLAGLRDVLSEASRGGVSGW